MTRPTCPECGERLDYFEEHCPDQHALLSWYWCCRACGESYHPDPEDYPTPSAPPRSE